MSWGQIIGSTINAIAGRSARKSAQKRQDTSITRTVRDALRAGINPLTAIRGGAVNGFSGQLHAGQTEFSQLSQAVGNTIDGALHKEPQLSRTEQIEQDLMAEQLHAIQYDNQMRTLNTRFYDPTKSFNTPSAMVSTTNSNTHSVSGGGGNLSGTTQLTPQERIDLSHGKSVRPEIERPKGVNPFPIWLNIEKPPTSTSVESFEDEFGDIGGQVIGTPLLAGEYVFHNTKRAVNRLKKDYKKSGWRKSPNPSNGSGWSFPSLSLEWD